MKIIFLLMVVVSLPGFAQQAENPDAEKTNKIPEIGTKVLPQEQEENPSAIPNPFQIGPYEGGKYIYYAPEEEKEANTNSQSQ